MSEFRKRTYHSLEHFLRDACFLTRNIDALAGMLSGAVIAPSFRKRLMLAVTSVNRCRFCSFFHSRLALIAGVTACEAERLLDGDTDHCPDNEIPALNYARYWAESDGNPDDESRRKLSEIYGRDTAQTIETVLRLIRMGNLSGNTLDYLLYRASSGRIGSC